MLSLLNPRHHSRAQLHSAGAPLGGGSLCRTRLHFLITFIWKQALRACSPTEPSTRRFSCSRGGGVICTLSRKFLLFFFLASHKKLFTAASRKIRGAQWAQERQHQYGNAQYLELSPGTTDTDLCTRGTGDMKTKPMMEKGKFRARG